MTSFRDRFKNRGLDLSSLRTFQHDRITLPELVDDTTDNGRFYTTPDGAIYPSITTVLGVNSKESIDRWKQKVGLEEAARISKKAADRGTRIHNMCEDYINGEYQNGKEIPNISNDRENFLKIKTLLDKNVGTVYALEVPLYSDTLELAGRTDLIADWDNLGRCIIDFKTATKPKQVNWITNYFQQGAGYCRMWEERVGTSIETVVIIIAVDNHPAQVFIVKRDDHLPGLIATREKYRKLYGK